MEKEVQFGISAEDTGFAAAMKAAQAQAVEASETIKASFESIGGVFQKLQGAFLIFTAALAGGEAFKAATAETVNMTKESVQLGRQFGISATQASQLKVAMASVFLTQDEVSAANAKITQALKKNESAFTDLGVATRDSNGNFRNSLDIMEDVNAKLLTFQEGTDRNVEGVKIYGKAWASVQDTLRLTPQVIEEAKAKADALGLTVGVESVAATQRYRTAMNDVHEVVEALEKALGDALLPILSTVGEWFGEHGPQMVGIFRAAIFQVQNIFIQFKGVIVNWVDSIAGSIDIAEAYIERFVNAVHAVFANKSAQEIAAVWEAGTKKIQQTTSTAFAIIKQDADETAKSVAEAFARSTGKETKIAAPAEGAHSDGGDDKEKSQLAALEEKLAAFKANYAEQMAIQGNFTTISKSEEREYWRAVLESTELSSADQISIRRKISEQTASIAKEGYEKELAAIKEQGERYKNNLEARLALAKEYAAKVTAAEGADSSKADEAAAKVLSIEREINAQKISLAQAAQKAQDAIALAGVEANEVYARQQVALGQESKTQLLAQEQQFENQRFAIKQQELQRELALLNQDPGENTAKIQQVNANIEQLALQHAAKMTQIANQGALEQNSIWKSVTDKMASGFDTAFNEFLKGSKTLSQTVHSLFADIAQSIASTLTQIAAKNIATMIEQAAVGKSLRAKEIQGDASKAASGAYAAIAGIPYVGPILAPIAAAAAYAGVLAFDSAEEGYDIPAGVNPKLQAHEREMVLPREQADVIRRLSKGNGEFGAGAQGGGDTHHWHIQAVDANSFKKMLKNEGPTISEALLGHARKTGRLAPGH